MRAASNLPAYGEAMADDRTEIDDLVARYVEAVACFDVELYRSLWADDAEWVVDGRGTFRGPDAITELFADLRRPQELAVQRITGGRSDVDGDRGSGRWIIHSLTRTDGTGTELIGIYDDEYVRVEAGWRFRQRAFRPLYRGPRDLPGRVFPPAG